jgi:hypothetical protein
MRRVSEFVRCLWYKKRRASRRSYTWRGAKRRTCKGLTQNLVTFVTYRHSASLIVTQRHLSSLSVSPRCISNCIKNNNWANLMYGTKNAHVHKPLGIPRCVVASWPIRSLEQGQSTMSAEMIGQISAAELHVMTLTVRHHGIFPCFSVFVRRFPPNPSRCNLSLYQALMIFARACLSAKVKELFVSNKRILSKHDEHRNAGIHITRCGGSLGIL